MLAAAPFNLSAALAYGYDQAFGVVHRFDNGLTNLFCPDLLCAGVATPLTTVGSGQWEALFLSPAVTTVPLPNAVALFAVALLTLTLFLARPLSYDQLTLRLH